MRLAIIGPPRSGKTTLFNALTGLDAATGVGSEGQVHLGQFRVPDPLLDELVAQIPHPKVTHTSVEMADIPGGSDPTATGGVRGLDESVMRAARLADALVLVVRAFARPSVPPPSGKVDPLADLEAAWTDMLVADLGPAEKRLDRLEGLIKRGGAGPDEVTEAEGLRKVTAALDAAEGVDSVDLGEEEERVLRGFGFLSAKPRVVVVNVGEESLPERVAPGWEEWAAAHRARILPLCADLVSELGRMEPEEAAVFAAEYDTSPEGAERVIRAAYEALDVVTFYTAGGEKEARAWTLRRGGSALDAAGTIHSDLARGFIRAEVIAARTLIDQGNWPAARKAGLVRQEGKTYRVQDGDVLNIKFAI